MGHAVALTGPFFLLALVLAPRGTPRPPQDPAKPPSADGARPIPPPKKLQSIAGLAGFESVSTILYATAADRPHQLRATYVFPERVRWQITAPEKTAPDRVVEYRYGDAFFRLPPGSARSEECEPGDRARLGLQMELRRALMLYPDGFEWKGSGLDRRAELGELGSLFAHFALESDKRPTEIGDAGPDGKIVDTYKSIQYRELRARVWPSSMEMWHAGELVWKETVDSVEVQGRFVDAFFVPPDRRDRSTAEPVDEGRRELELPATCSLRIDVAKGTSWEDALATRTRAFEDWARRLAEQKLELDRNTIVEISTDGEPIAIVLRLASVPAQPPPGFLTAEPRHGQGLAVGGVREVTPARIAELRKALPAGATPGIPYVRLDPSHAAGAERVWIVLPYSRAH